MGLTGQAATVDELLTGRENLRLIGRLAGLPRRSIRPIGDDLLERFSLTEAADRIVKTYSGGMRRRLDLAVSLIAAPPVLFLDEPTTGLDPRSRNDLWDVLRGLVAEGTTLLLTTQYLEEADQLCDDIVVIDKGRVIAAGHADPAQGPGRPGERGAHRDRRRPTSSEAERLLRGGARRGVRRAGRRAASPRRPTGSRDMTRIGRLLGDHGIAVDDLGPQAPQPRRRLPAPDRPPGRGRGRRTTPTRPTPEGRRRDDRPTSPSLQPHHRPPAAGRSRAAVASPCWRCRRRGAPQPDPHQADARAAAGRDHPAGDVRAAVRLRLRQLDRRARLELPRVPGARDHGADHRVLLVHRGDRADQRPGEGHRRPAPVAADLTGPRCWSAGRISSLIHSSIGITVMALTGLLIGWRIRDGVAARRRRRSRCCCSSASR